MKVLVTGGSGLVGNYVIERLKSKYEVIILDTKKPVKHEDVEFRQVDLLSPEQSTSAIDDDTDVIVHLAAIPNPFNDSPDRVLHVNTLTSFNLLQAIREKKIPRIIYGSSNSVTGFGIQEVMHKPLYLPLDAEHPCWPHESYSLSKYFGEVMFKEYSRAFNIETISIRFMWVWLENVKEIIMEVINGQAKKALEGLGAYVLPQDVAQTIDLAITYKMDEANSFPFEIFNAHAAQTFLPTDTLEQAKKIWSDIPPIKKPEYYEKNPRAPFYDITDACEKLGYKPEYSYKDFERVVLNREDKAK